MSLASKTPEPSPGRSEPWRQHLSAAMDGEADALHPACDAWRSHGQARAAWHAYHLIGDVLRSEELASRPARDEAFLQNLRQRLAAEPVVLVPADAAVAVGRPARAHARWLTPVAAAAGFVVVAGVLVVSQGSLPGAPGSGPAAGGPLVVSAPAAPTEGGVSPANRVQMIRDARLDEYLQAHQAARGGVGVSVPGGALRRVDAELSTGPQQ